MIDDDNSALVNLTTTPNSAFIGASQRVRAGKDNPYRASAGLRVDQQNPKIKLTDKDDATLFSRP
jgi:hypothetical protein